MKVSLIREFLDLLSNLVLVKKANGRLKMCADFTGLNKGCSKDYFPLMWINLIVNSIVGQKLLRFMDIFLGYNQIKL